MWTEELRARVSKLDEEVAKLEKEISPLREQLARLQEYRKHALRLLELENGALTKLATAETVVPRKPSGEPHWRAIADERGYRVNGDSAHRVIRNRDGQLHGSISHHCTYDGRSYP
jgi:chromosome segregation ATPase